MGPEVRSEFCRLYMVVRLRALVIDQLKQKRPHGFIVLGFLFPLFLINLFFFLTLTLKKSTKRPEDNKSLTNTHLFFPFASREPHETQRVRVYVESTLRIRAFQEKDTS